MPTTTTTSDNAATAPPHAAVLADFRQQGIWEEGDLAGYADRFALADPDRVQFTDGYATLTRGEARAQAYRRPAR